MPVTKRPAHSAVKRVGTNLPFCDPLSEPFRLRNLRAALPRPLVARPDIVQVRRRLPRAVAVRPFVAVSHGGRKPLSRRPGTFSCLVALTGVRARAQRHICFVKVNTLCTLR